MRNEYDFSKGKRGSVIADSRKMRITIMLDGDVIAFFRAKAEAQGTGYQTLINGALRDAMRSSQDRKAGDKPLTVATLRKVLREEFNL
jgi:uncharacterized protein (DUF4415 family)